MDFSNLDRFLDTLADEGIPGTDLCVFRKGAQVFRKQTGLADIEAKEPITNDTLYAMWSMTKPIVCTAALRLYEQGLYLLQDPLCQYLPEFKDMTYRKMRGSGHNSIERCKNPIRITDLFTMSSGLSYDISGELVKAADTAPAPDLKHFVLALAKEPLCFEPGTRYRYGLSHDVLGRLIEVLSGKTLGEYLKENIFAPLGMEDTCFDLALPAEKKPRLATVYTFDEATRKNTKTAPVLLPGNWKAESGGGGLISSVDDYAKFAYALSNGGTARTGYRLLGKATVELMRQDHLDRRRLRDYTDSICNSKGYSYGLGVRTLINKAQAGSGSSIGEFGWSGMLGTYLLIDPQAELFYVYAQQLLPSKEEWTAPRLRNVVYGCL